MLLSGMILTGSFPIGVQSGGWSLLHSAAGALSGPTGLGQMMPDDLSLSLRPACRLLERTWRRRWFLHPYPTDVPFFLLRHPKQQERHSSPEPETRSVWIKAAAVLGVRVGWRKVKHFAHIHVRLCDGKRNGGVSNHSWK